MASNFDPQKGRITIKAAHVSGLTLPFLIKVTFPNASTNSYNATQLPWVLGNLEDAGYYDFLIEDDNGLLRQKQMYVPAIDCNNNPDFQSTSDTADCTDTDVDVTPQDMLNDGYNIISAEIVSGKGTITANTGNTQFLYNVPNVEYSGTVTIEFTAGNGSDTRKKLHYLTVNCASAPPSDGPPTVEKQAYCTSGTVDVTPTLPEGWTLIEILTPNGLEYGSYNPSKFPKIIYTPDINAGQGGDVVEEFGYLAEDASGREREGIIEVTIGCALPVAPTLNISLLCNESPVPVFKNTVQQIFDVNPNSAIYIQSLSNGDNGTVNYIPGETAAGRGWQYNLTDTNAETDQLDYVIVDAAGQTAQGVINVTIVATENCGQGGGGIVNPMVVKTCDGAVYIPLAIPNGYVLQGFSHDNLQHSDFGTLTQDNSGQYNFTPGEDFDEDYTFNYTVRNNADSTTETSTITIQYECDPCELSITAKHCPSGFIRSSVQLGLDQNDNLSYDDGDTLKFEVTIPNDGTQDLASVEVEVLSGQGHTVVDNDPLEFTLAAVDDFIRFRYRVTSLCSGFVSEWKIQKVTRDGTASGFSNEFFDANDNPIGDGVLYYPPFVKIVVPEDEDPVITAAVLALEDSANPSATQSIELLNENGNPAGVGSDVTLDTDTLQAQHINGNGGKLYGYILIEGCDTPIKTPVIDVPAFMGLPYES